MLCAVNSKRTPSNSNSVKTTRNGTNYKENASTYIQNSKCRQSTWPQ